VRDRLLWLGCLVYAVLFTWLGSIKYDAHRNLVDFGIFAQTAASAFGCFCNPIEGSHWGFHFSPVLYAAGLALALVHSPLTLVALQAVAGALTAPPIYGLVRARSDVNTARLAAVVTWLYPPLAGLIFGDFHENGFAPAAVAWTLYAFDAGNLVGAAVAAIAALSIKEDQAVFLAIGGAVGAWHYRGTARGRLAGGIALLSVVVLIAFFEIIRPHAAAATSWQPMRFYAWNAPLAESPAAAFGSRAGFVALIFVPLLFLPFRSKMMWLAAAPLAEVLFSRMPTTFTLGTHYAGAWIGYVLAPFACAAANLPAPRRRAALFTCIGLCIVELAVANPLHPGLNLRLPQSRDVVLDRFLSAVPRDASVATQEEAYTHLALSNPDARLLPETAQQPMTACLLLIDWNFPESARLQEYGPEISRLVAAGSYVSARKEDGIELFRRVGFCR
jgi:hypothetical protein